MAMYSLLLTFFFVFGTLQLFYVQTPNYFFAAPIDFGRIEK